MRSQLLFRTMYCVVVMLLHIPAQAQDTANIQLHYAQQRLNDSEVALKINYAILPGIKLYALQTTDADVLYSSLEFDSSITSKLDGNIAEHGKVQNGIDESLNSKVYFFTDSGYWQQKIKAALNDSFAIKGKVNLFYNKHGNYIADERPFKVYVDPPFIAAAGITANKSLLWIFFSAFAGGLLALLTPCVYSMIPVTVSFFIKRSRTKKHGIRNALYYSASIIIIFTLFGFLITFLFGPAALNNLATNWIANLFFFIVFILFGISFLGGFEITLPASWSTKADTKAGLSSFGGIFFMALTLVLVSFSCTGPIIGNLIVLAAKGNFYGPLVGMFGFSAALALPFSLFAFFPSKINMLGRAGGWLNAIKVTLGFLELALAMKFLSNADLSKGWRLLDREIFLSIWMGIFLALGFYLFGLIRFKHDDALPENDFGAPHLSVTRLFFAMASFCFVFYMVPGLAGAPLKGISAFLPPMGTQDFTAADRLNTNETTQQNSYAGNTLPKPVKYAANMLIYEPDVVKKYGITTYFDYNEALQIARQQHKPLMLDFTGINCVNCRKMESQVWSDPEVLQQLKTNFIIASLYVDAQHVDIPRQEQFYSKALEKQVETLGDKNADMQVSAFGANTQPYYFFLDDNEQQLVSEGYGYDPDIKKFSSLLRQIKNKFAAEGGNNTAGSY